MSDPALPRHQLWLAVGLTLTAFKLWLSRGQGIFAIGDAGYDDRLFLELAQHLVRGEWLGPYNELTLAKGPFYSIFIAAVFSLGVPLFLAQQVFYAAACALFTRALRPAVTSAGARLAIYALLLCNPMSFDAASLGRVLRQHVYGPLGLMIFAGLTALYLRRAGSARQQLPWALLLGLAAGAFYLTREEGVWLVPSALLLASAYLVGSWKISPATARRAAGWLGLTLAVAALPVWFVSAQNQRHYGWFGTCEFRAADFQDAYGAMLRVRVGPELPFVPVTREARQAMAAVSPAFAAVEAELARDLARNWAGASAALTGLPPEQEQVGGGWMIWAFREAVARAGPHDSARPILARYRQIAREINAACADGRLPAGPPHSGFLPPWRGAQTNPFARALVEFVDFVVRFGRFSARPLPSTGSPEELVLFRDLTGERLSPPEGELDVVGAAEYLLNLWKVGVLHQTGKALRPVLLGLFLLAQTLMLLRVAEAVWRRRWTFPLTVAAAAWGAGAASLVIYAMIEATSFPVLTIVSFAPIYPLLLVFIIAVAWDVFTAWTSRPSVATQPTPPPSPSATPDAPPLRTLHWLAGLVALLPCLIWHREFRELFWFADDLVLLDQMAMKGVFQWTTQLVAGDFLPLFKSLWSGAVLGFDGSYLAMLGLLWLTHAVNTVLLGRLLQRAGFPWFANLVTLVCFALTPANLETLGWATQWSAVLATSFLLLALEWHARYPRNPGGFSWKHHLPLFLLVAASAGSATGGVLTGAVVAGGLLLPALGEGDRRALLSSLPGAFLCLLPVAIVTLLPGSSGHHRLLSAPWGETLAFGAGYFLLNPGHLLFGETSLHPAVLLLLAAAKLGLIISALWLARGRVRHLLLLLLAYDLGSAVLVGIGRYHTGFLASMSSRYQYGSLLATLPFAALLLALTLDRMPLGRHRSWVAATVAVLLAGRCLWGWPTALNGFTDWRGTDLRRLIAAPATSDPAARVPGLEFMHIERAKALQRTYNLH